MIFQNSILPVERDCIEVLVCCVAAPNVGRVGFAAGVCPNDKVFDVPNDGVDVVVVVV